MSIMDKVNKVDKGAPSVYLYNVSIIETAPDKFQIIETNNVTLCT